MFVFIQLFKLGPSFVILIAKQGLGKQVQQWVVLMCFCRLSFCQAGFLSSLSHCCDLLRNHSSFGIYITCLFYPPVSQHAVSGKTDAVPQLKKTWFRVKKPKTCACILPPEQQLQVSFRNAFLTQSERCQSAERRL